MSRKKSFWRHLVGRVAAMWRRHMGVRPLSTSIRDLNEWTSSTAGQAITLQEIDMAQGQLQMVFGFHIATLSTFPSDILTQECRVQHHFRLDALTQTGGQARTDFNRLPLADESIDAVVLRHVLDYSQSPHHVLREAARVLIPRGHVLIVGFNPYSLLGIYAFFARFFSSKPRWRMQFLSPLRLMDWLTLVELEPLNVEYGFFRPPLANEKALKYLHWMERWGTRWRIPFGGIVMVLARKDRAPLTPLKPSWKTEKTEPGLVVIKIRGPVLRRQLLNKWMY